jgi:glycerophosphoryl diester phosphodiesterase
MPSVQTLLLLGHRGDRHAARENTISAFDRALENGCDGFEFDVRLTLDGQAIIFHDPKVSGVSIARNTFPKLRARESTGAGRDRLPLLDDVMARYAATAFLDIELKVPGLESKLIALLEKHPSPRGYVISSFLPQVIETLAQQDPSLTLGFICESPRILPRWRELPVQYVIPKYRLINAGLLDACHRAKRKVLVWTLNQPSTMHEMADLGVDGIISDDTKLLVETLRPSA